MQDLGMILVILLATLVGGQISARCGLPAVIGELLAGVVIGPAILNWIQASSLINNLADFGVILLMFLAGLESDLDTLKRLWRPSLLVAVWGMIVPIVTAYITGICFGFSQLESLLLGLTFAATSVSISVAVLQEMGKLESKEGLTILGAAVVDDLLAVVLLSVASSFAGVATEGSGQSQQLPVTLLFQAIYLLVLWAFSVWAVPRLMHLAKRLSLPASETLVGLIIVILAAWGAEKTGLSNVIGAFFVGLALSRTSARKKLQHNFTVIGYSSLIPIFFASIGLKMTLTGIIPNAVLFIVLLAGSILSKLLGAGLGARFAGYSNASALVVGSGMVSRGEMALVIAQIGLQNHLLAASAYSTIIGVIIVTTLLAPVMLRQTLSKKRPI